MSTNTGRLKLSEKLWIYQRWTYNTKLHDRKKRKMGRSGFEWSWFSNGIKVPRYSVLWNSVFFIFCLETKVKNNTWMREISVTVMVIILKVPPWRLLDISFVQSSFSTITKATDKAPYSWRFHGHGSTYMLIHSWVNIMKQKWVKVTGKLSVEQKIWVCSSKNIVPRHFIYCYILLFLSNKPSF